jgi:PKD repeat protein/LysM repeat protein
MLVSLEQQSVTEKPLSTAIHWKDVSPVAYTKKKIPLLLTFLLLIFMAGLGISLLQPITFETVLLRSEIVLGPLSVDGNMGPLEAIYLGSGGPEVDRSVDLIHTVQSGQSFNGIAYTYNIDPYLLATYNNISNPGSIRVGERINIPSLSTEKLLSQNTTFDDFELAIPSTVRTDQEVPVTPTITIRANKKMDGTGLTAFFWVHEPVDANFRNYYWSLGNGKRSFDESTHFTYDKPGTYKVTLRAIDQQGRTHLSNKIFIDVPHPTTFYTGTQQFVTLDDRSDPLWLDGPITSVNGYDEMSHIPFRLLGEQNGKYKYQATETGYFNLTTRSDNRSTQVFVFVSPIPSKHVDRADINWYRTQFNTGTASNCGPSVVSMAIAWSSGRYVSIPAIRDSIGWSGDGGTSFSELSNSMKDYGIPVKYTRTGSPQDIRDIIDAGNIAVVLFYSGGISLTASRINETHFGRYYPRHRRALRPDQGVFHRRQILRGLRPHAQRLLRQQ